MGLLTGTSRSTPRGWLMAPTFSPGRISINPKTGLPYSGSYTQAQIAPLSEQQGGLTSFRNMPEVPGMSLENKTTPEGALRFKEDTGPSSLGIKKAGAGQAIDPMAGLLQGGGVAIGGPLETLSAALALPSAEPAIQPVEPKAGTGYVEGHELSLPDIYGNNVKVTPPPGILEMPAQDVWNWADSLLNTPGSEYDNLNISTPDLVEMVRPELTFDINGNIVDPNSGYVDVPAGGDADPVGTIRDGRMKLPDGSWVAQPPGSNADQMDWLYWADAASEGSGADIYEVLQIAGAPAWVAERIPSLIQYGTWPPPEGSDITTGTDETYQGGDYSTVRSIDDLGAFGDYVLQLIQQIDNEGGAYPDWLWGAMEQIVVPLLENAVQGSGIGYEVPQFGGLSSGQNMNDIISTLQGLVQNLGNQEAWSSGVPGELGDVQNLASALIGDRELLRNLNLDQMQIAELEKLAGPITSLQGLFNSWLQQGYEMPVNPELTNRLTNVQNVLSSALNNYEYSSEADIGAVDPELEAKWKAWLDEILGMDYQDTETDIDLSPFMPDTTTIEQRLDTINKEVEAIGQRYMAGELTHDKMMQLLDPLETEMKELRARREAGETTATEDPFAGMLKQLSGDVGTLIGESELREDWLNPSKEIDPETGQPVYARDEMEDLFRGTLTESLQKGMGYTRNEAGEYEYTGVTGFDQELKDALYAKAKKTMDDEAIAKGIYNSPASLEKLETYLSEVDIQDMMYAEEKRQTSVDQSMRFTEFLSSANLTERQQLFNEAVKEEEIRAQRETTLGIYRQEILNYYKEMDQHQQAWANVEISRIETEEKINAWKRESNQQLMEFQNTALATKRGDERTEQALALDQARVNSIIKATDYQTVVSLSESLHSQVQQTLAYQLEKAALEEGINSDRYNTIKSWQENLRSFGLEEALAEEGVRAQRVQELRGALVDLSQGIRTDDQRRIEEWSVKLDQSLAELQGLLQVDRATREGLQQMVDFITTNQSAAIGLFGAETERILGQAQAALGFMGTEYEAHLGELDRILKAEDLSFSQYLDKIMTEEYLTTAQHGRELDNLNALLTIIGLPTVADGQNLVSALGVTGNRYSSIYNQGQAKMTKFLDDWLNGLGI